MKVIGHRGAAGLAPENTIESIQRAIKEKVDLVEFDLRVSKDKVVILQHDRLISVNGRQLVVKDNSFDLLKKAKPNLANLNELLAAIRPNQVGLFIEVKPAVETEPIIQIVEAALSKGWLPGQIYLASFSLRQLIELKARLTNPNLIVLEKWSGVRASSRARKLQTDKICLNQKYLWFGFIKAVRRSGLELYTYTLNNPKKARRWARYGLAGVITDYPDRFN